MKRLIKQVTVVSALGLSCTAAFAAGSLQARVVAVEDGQVVLETAEPVPEWLAEGAAVQALGWKSQVADVENARIVLSLSASRAARIEPGAEVVVREIPKQQRFGC